eukprot:1519491-Rhodomonas_salina.1
MLFPTTTPVVVPSRNKKDDIDDACQRGEGAECGVWPRNAGVRRACAAGGVLWNARATHA